MYLEAEEVGEDLPRWKGITRKAGYACSTAGLVMAAVAVAVKITAGRFPVWVVVPGILLCAGVIASAVTGDRGGGWDPGKMG